MTEILDRVKSELGRDAIIYQSSSKPKLFRGGKRFEVVAGKGSSHPVRPVRPRIRSEQAVHNREALESLVASVKPGAVLSSPILPGAAASSSSPLENTELLRREIEDLKWGLKALHPQIEAEAPKTLRKVRNWLYQSGAGPSVVEPYLKTLSGVLGNRLETITMEALLRVASRLIEKRWHHLQRGGSPAAHPVKFLTGPTGSGKTTTLAKLASLAALKEKREVHLVSLDDYRMGAHEQLKSYADILMVPFHAIRTPAAFRGLLDTLAPSVEVYVDTSGVSPNNSMGIRKIASYVGQVPGAEVYLVLTAQLPFREHQEIMAKFSVLPFDRLVLSKLDEGSGFGHLLHFVYQSLPPIAFLTVGQNVPEDIQPFSPSTLASKILEVP